MRCAVIEMNQIRGEMVHCKRQQSPQKRLEQQGQFDCFCYTLKTLGFESKI